MALRALEVPVLREARPVKHVTRPDTLLRIQVKPSLPACLPGPRVPADAERLISSARKRDQILLERAVAEGVGHLVLVRLAVRAFGRNEELAVASEETRLEAGIVERDVRRSCQAPSSRSPAAWRDRDASRASARSRARDTPRTRRPRRRTQGRCVALRPRPMPQASVPRAGAGTTTPRLLRRSRRPGPGTGGNAAGDHSPGEGTTAFFRAFCSAMTL